MPTWTRMALTAPLAAILALSTLPAVELHAQDPEAAEARYEAAMNWVTLLADEDFAAAAARSHPSVSDRMTASALEEAWTQLQPQLGGLVSLEPRAQTMQEGLILVILTGVWDEVENTDVQVFMGEDHSVAGFFVRPPQGG